MQDFIIVKKNISSDDAVSKKLLYYNKLRL